MAVTDSIALGAATSETIPVRSDGDIVEARRRMREMAEQLPFSPGDVAMMATAVSELARNILNYAGRGEIVLRLADARGRRGLVVVARDSGPGIADLARAMEDGYSTGQGLGLGLPGCKRLMDDFDLASELGVGTTVTTTKWAGSP